jgi:peptide/nickel transport system substrate-binding protein
MKFTRHGRGGARTRAGLAMLATLGVVTLAACGGGSGDKSSDGPSTTSISDLVVDVGQEPDSLDPFYRNTGEAQRFYRLVYSSVLKWNEDGSVAPDLAAELPVVSDDGLTWTIKLKEGVTFHDGTPLTADDVVFSYQTAAKPENGSVWLSALSYMKSVEATDDTTVTLTLTEPYAYMESRFAMIPILSDETKYATNATYATKENGSGPYTLASLKRGDSINLTQNADYFGDKAPFKTIQFKIVPEDASRVARLLNGESHILPDLPTDQVDLVKKRGANAQIVKENVTRLFLYPSMNADRPTSNVDYRLAIAYAADRKRIVDQVYAGAGRPNSTYLTYGSLHHDEKVGLSFGDKPNVAEAKKHLAASGVDPSRKLKIIAVNKPSVVSAMTILQANLKEIGIEATVDTQEVAGFYSALVSGEYDLIGFDSPASTSAGFAPDYVNGGLNSKAANNFAKFKDAEMDKLLDVALTAQGEDEQAAAWKAVQERDVQTQGNIQLVVSQTSEAWSNKLAGYKPSALLWLNTVLDVK